MQSLGTVGDQQVLAWGLRLVLRQTDVLDPDQCQRVDALLGADVTGEDG